MGEKSPLWKTVSNYLRGAENSKKLLLIGAVLGVALLVLPELSFKKTETNKDTAVFSAAFVEQTERQLTAIIGSIEGAGACKVMLTLEKGVEYVYATQQKTNSDRQENNGADENRLTQRNDSETAAIVIDTGEKREGLLVTEIQPTVRGVVVVCEGGDREEVRTQVAEAVTVALNISSKRVYVTKLS